MGIPKDIVRHHPHEPLHAFVLAAAQAAGMSDAHAALLADLLIANDLRGNLSHGSLQIHRYVREIQTSGINPTPNVTCVNETPNSFIMDGDGGLGYFPSHAGALKLIDKADEHGMAAMVTRYHGHFGAAGIYTRMAAEADLIAFMTSGVQLNLKPGASITAGAGASPMSFAAPANEAPDLVVDIGVTHEIQGKTPPPKLPLLIEHTPSVVLRALSLGNICQTWGGLLTGMHIDPARARPEFKAANQGAMMFAFKVSLFADLAEFKAEVDAYARAVRELEPIANSEGAYLPGSLEAQREARFRAEGVPIGSAHEQALQKASELTGVPLPW